MELYVFFFNNGRPQTTCMLSMKFGTGIEDSLHYLYNNFGRHHSSTLPPPIGQIWACLFPPYCNSELFQKQVFTNFLYLSTNLDIEHHETNQEKKVASQTYDLRNHPSRTRKRIWRQSHQIGHEVITQIGDPGGLKEFFCQNSPLVSTIILKFVNSTSEIKILVLLEHFLEHAVFLIQPICDFSNRKSDIFFFSTKPGGLFFFFCFFYKFSHLHIMVSSG